MSAVDKAYYALMAIVLIPCAIVCIGCGIFAWWKVVESIFGDSQ